MNRCHLLFPKLPKHSPHAACDTEIGIAHMNIEHPAIHNRFHLKLPVKQMMALIGQKHGIMQQRQPKQSHPQRFCQPFFTIQKRKRQPGRPDKADSHIGNTISQVFHPLCHGKPQKELRNTPDNHQKLTYCQSRSRPASLCLEDKPAAAISRKPDCKQI